MTALDPTDAALAADIRARFPCGVPIDCHAVAGLAPSERRALDAEVFRRLYPERFEEGKREEERGIGLEGGGR
jgi:hypothetical protein